MDSPKIDCAVRERSLARCDIEAMLAARSPGHLIECDLEEADLSGLDLSGWTFERCNLRRSDFAVSKLKRTVCARVPSNACATMPQPCITPKPGRRAVQLANWIGADLSDAQFVSSDLNNTVRRRAILTASECDRCKLTGADMSDAKVLDLRFVETLLINVKLPSFTFRKQRLKKVDFSEADLGNCDFRDTVFEDCSLRDANDVGSRFNGADLQDADLGGMRLIDTRIFRGATISHDQAAQLLRKLSLIKS